MDESTQVVDSTHVTLDWCDECSTVVRSNEPCGHGDLEWLKLVEW